MYKLIDLNLQIIKSGAVGTTKQVTSYLFDGCYVCFGNKLINYDFVSDALCKFKEAEICDKGFDMASGILDEFEIEFIFVGPKEIVHSEKHLEVLFNKIIEDYTNNLEVVVEFDNLSSMLDCIKITDMKYSKIYWTKAGVFARLPFNQRPVYQEFCRLGNAHSRDFNKMDDITESIRNFIGGNYEK